MPDNTLDTIETVSSEVDIIHDKIHELIDLVENFEDKHKYLGSMKYRGKSGKGRHDSSVLNSLYQMSKHIPNNIEEAVEEYSDKFTGRGTIMM